MQNEGFSFVILFLINDARLILLEVSREESVQERLMKTGRNTKILGILWDTAHYVLCFKVNKDHDE